MPYPRSRIDGYVQSHCLIDGKLHGYGRDAIPSYGQHCFAMKWNSCRANTQFSSSLLTAYDVSEQAVVTPENWIGWVVYGATKL